MVVWDGVGLGAGGFGGGVRDGLGFGVLDERVGVGRAVGLVLDDGAAFCVALPAAALCACPLVRLADGVAPARAAALACEPGPRLGDGLAACAAVVATA